MSRSEGLERTAELRDCPSPRLPESETAVLRDCETTMNPRAAIRELPNSELTLAPPRDASEYSSFRSLAVLESGRFEVSGMAVSDSGSLWGPAVSESGPFRPADPRPVREPPPCVRASRGVKSQAEPQDFSHPSGAQASLVRQLFRPIPRFGERGRTIHGLSQREVRSVP